MFFFFFFFSSRRRHTRYWRDWSSDVCSSDLGPDPATDGVVRWRCADLRAQVKRRFAVTVHERTIGKWLRRRDLTWLQPRPAHPRQDVAAQEAFKQISPS